MNGCTIGNRVLIHLSCYSRFREEYVCPQEMTQDGIANRLGISRAHVALELKRLRQKNQVEFRLAHVVKAKSRRKVYSLTKLGNDAAVELKDEARRKKVRILDGNVGVECSGHEAVKALASAGVPESDAFIKVLTTEAIAATNACRDDKGAVHELELIGREQEMERLGRWIRSPGKAVCVLTGNDGLGKSSLAISLSSTFGENSVRRFVRPLQSVRSILGEIADCLAEKGKTRLKAFMSRKEFEPREAVLTLAEELAGGLLVLDDLQNSPEIENFASLFMTMNDWPLKVLLISKRKPAFCQRWSDTFQKPYEDVPLAGLSLDCARRLIAAHAKSATEEGMSAAHAATQGRPQDLIMLAELGWRFDSDKVPSLGELLRARMIKEDMKGLKLAAISRAPIESHRAVLAPEQTSFPGRSSCLDEEEGRFVPSESLRNLYLEGLGESERKTLHAEAGRIEDLRGNSVAAAAHYIEAGLRDMAVNMISDMDPSEARDKAAELNCVLNSIGDDARLETIRGMTLESLGRFDEARASYERAVSRADDPSARSLLMLAEVESRMSLLAEAERHYSMAAAAAKKGKDDLGRARAVQGLAAVYRLRGDYDKATRGFTEAREILEMAGEWREAARCRMALGELELDRGNAAGAVAELTAAVQSTGPRDADSARALNDLGIACQGIGDEERAAALFSEAAKVADMFGQARVAARSFASAAKSRLRQGRYDEAAENCRKALRIGERLCDLALLSDVHATLGKLNKNLGLWKRAESHIVTSIGLTKSLNLPQLLASRYKDLAELYQMKGDARKAKLWTTRANRMMEWESTGKIATAINSVPSAE